MELLAFVHTAVNYEDPNPDPKVTLLEGVDLQLASSTGAALAGMAIAAAVVVGTPDHAKAASAIAPGASGEAVTHVQKALGISADGQYGPKTTAAVMDFQIRQGLKQVDGTVGKETAIALGLDEKYQPVHFGYGEGYVDTYYDVGLNVRSGPGTDYRKIGGYYEGEDIYTYGEVVSYDYDWQQVAPGAWVATDYIDYYYEPASHHDDYGDCYEYCYDEYYDDCSDDYYYHESSYSDGGGYVYTRHNVGLNIRSGPGLHYEVVDGAFNGDYLESVDGTVHNDGYTWEQLSDGSWYASDYTY